MSDQQNKPLLVMFAGPNGSGKSTVTPAFRNQPGFPNNYINPDEIASTLGGNTMEKAYEASAIAARERLRCIEQKESFAFETVMSHPSKLAILETAKKAGFETQVIFVSTDNPAANVERVRKRVEAGGHDVPEDKVISRYHRSLSLLPKATEIADRTYIFDNSSQAAKLKAVLSQDEILEQSEEKIAWVENILSTLDERKQEKLAFQAQYLNSSVAFLDEGQYDGEIKSVGNHFLVQQATDGQTVIHDNSVLGATDSIVGDRATIGYQNGVHQLTNNTQKERVERIAPILLDYLRLKQKSRVETDSSVVEFDSDTKTISYQNKLDSQENLTAQFSEGKWRDRGSNISQTKESYFVNEVAPKIKAQLKQQRPPNSPSRRNSPRGL